MWCSLLELSFNDVEPESFTSHTLRSATAPQESPHPPAYFTVLFALNKEYLCVFSRIHPITNIARRSFPVPLRLPHLKCRLRSGPRHSLILPINLKIPLKSQSDGAKPGALLHFRSHADEEPNRTRRPSLSQSRQQLPLKRWLKRERLGLVFISEAKNTSWSKGSVRGAEKREREKTVAAFVSRIWSLGSTLTRGSWECGDRGFSALAFRWHCAKIATGYTWAPVNLKHNTHTALLLYSFT